MTIYIVDDHDAFRSQLRALLEADGFAVIGETSSGARAIADCADLDPDVLLLDVELPDIDGFAVAEAVASDARRSRVRRPAILMISSRDAADYGPRLAHGAALAFIRKDELSGSRIRALASAR